MYISERPDGRIEARLLDSEYPFDQNMVMKKYIGENVHSTFEAELNEGVWLFPATPSFISRYELYIVHHRLGFEGLVFVSRD